MKASTKQIKERLKQSYDYKVTKYRLIDILKETYGKCNDALLRYTATKADLCPKGKDASAVSKSNAYYNTYYMTNAEVAELPVYKIVFKAKNKNFYVRSVSDIRKDKAENVGVQKPYRGSQNYRDRIFKSVPASQTVFKYKLKGVDVQIPGNKIGLQSARLSFLGRTQSFAIASSEQMLFAFMNGLQQQEESWNSAENLPRVVQEALIDCYRGGGGGSILEKILDKVLALRGTKFGSKLLAVPAKYKRAYRLMTSVEEKDLKSILGKAPKKEGVVKGGTYKPYKNRLGSSWTVNASIFRSMDIINSIGMHQEEDSYMILLEADLEAHREKFLYNPDTLPNYLKTGNFGKEREVLGLGPIPLVRIVYRKVGAQELEKLRGKDRVKPYRRILQDHKKHSS